MLKCTNPFNTIQEAMSILNSLETDPAKCNKTYEPWQEHILSIVVQRTYEKGTHYHTCSIHLSKEGFDYFIALVGECPVTVKPHLADFDEHIIEPSPLLRLFKLVPRPSQETEQ